MSICLGRSTHKFINFTNSMGDVVMGVAVINMMRTDSAPEISYDRIIDSCNAAMSGCSKEDKLFSPYSLCASSIINSVFLKGSVGPLRFTNA